MRGGAAVSIQLIARDLYRIEQEVSALEKRLEACTFSEREGVEDLLRKARAGRNRMRDILEGAKEEPSCRRPR
jgi:hypothetical protein